MNERASLNQMCVGSLKDPIIYFIDEGSEKECLTDSF